MEGLLHPVGPEEERTYWVRRGIVLAILVVLLFGVGSMIGSLGGTESAAAPVEVNAVPDPAAAAGPAAAPAAAPAAVGGVPDAVASEEAVPLPATAATAAAQPPPAAPAASAPAKEESLPPEPTNTFHQTTAPGAAPANPLAPAELCDLKAVKVGMDGPRKLEAGRAVTFKVKVKVENGGDRDCAVVIDDKNFELKISSGNKRVWTTRDCAANLPSRSAVLAPGRELEWQLEWLANRSEAQCKTAPERLPAGTYVATAQLRDARSAQVIMELAA